MVNVGSVMPPDPPQKWAVYAVGAGWLVDTCAGGRFSYDVDEALWFDSADEILPALRAAEMAIVYTPIRVK